jgi:redox-sensing transcriptional repressor
LETYDRLQKLTVSSAVLGRALAITDAQVRKDLAYFGQFGYPGVGYRVSELIVAIKRILGTDKTWSAALVGVGNMGRALIQYRGFARRGFRVAAAFDSDDAKIGEVVGHRKIQPLKELESTVRRRKIQLGIITVPAEAAQEIADKLVAAGVRGLLNFAPVQIDVRAGVSVVAVDLAIQLEQLCFQVG